MPRVRDLIRFRQDRFFGGAVQLDWFYDEERSRAAARSFVFHGPRYFGVDPRDIGVKPRELMDTCCFSHLISERLYGDTGDQNPFIMGIAGYGTGKSHLALTLAMLFSGHDKATAQEVIHNIAVADADIGKAIESSVTKPNLVIPINGMRDFNLNYEILNAARRSLLLHGHDDSPLRSLTKSHEIAARFLERNFERLHDEFVRAAAKRFPNTPPDQLLSTLRASLLMTGDAFEVINQVYFQENGSYIRWDDGISAAEILEQLSRTVCGERGYFNKVLIIFDEFGRFIEYAAQYPASAAESALQQVFEAIQNSSGNIVMVGLIQSDLRSYLARVDKSSNIIRYVGRYETAEKVYLSSNLETIFAHLIKRSDPEAFEHYVTEHLTRNDAELREIHNRLLALLPGLSQKSVWRDWNHFRSVIVEGTYPLHPITTWMLTNLSEWLQQRSALTFVHDALERFGDEHIERFGDLPYIRPIQLIQSDFFNELLFAEEQGRQQSDFCSQYDNILRRHRDRLDDNHVSVMAANVIARIGRFRTSSRDEAELLLADCSGLSREEVATSLHFLEDELGVLSFDPLSGSFDFIEDAVGARDFKLLIERKRRSTKVNLSLIFDGDIRQVLGLDTVQQCGFADLRYIKTQEWDFTQEVVWGQDLTDERLKTYLKEWKLSTAPDKPKSKVIWIYLSPASPTEMLEELRVRIAKHGLFDTPIIFMILDDAAGQLYEALIDWQVARSLTDEEKRRFDRFVPAYLDKTEAAVQDAFEKLQLQRLHLTSSGIVNALTPVRSIVLETLNRIYPSAIPFMFEGFRAKNYAQARKNLSYIARNVCSGLISYQWVLAQNSEVRNRLQAVLFVGAKGSWGVLNEDYKLVPPADATLRTVFSELDTLLEGSSEQGLNLGEALDRLTAPPFGANDYSAALLLATYLALKQTTLKITLRSERVRLGQWAEKAFLDKGIDLRVFRETTIQQIDLEDTKSRFLATCNAIETNTSLNKWSILLQSLDNLCKEDEPPPELADKIAVCRLIASRGTEVWQEYERFIKEQISFLHRAKEEGDVGKALGVLIRCENQLQNGASLERYAYGPEEKQTLKQMIDAADDVINDNFERWMKSLRCDNYAQFSAFHSSVMNRVNQLRSAGYEEFARQLKAHLDHIEENMNEIKMRQTVQEAVDRFIQICKPNKYTSYQQLLAWQDEGKKLLEYVASSLNKLTARGLIDAISDRLADVEQLLQEYRDEIASIIDDALEVGTPSDCHSLLDRARAMLDRSIRAEDASDIREIADALANLIRDIESVEKYKEDLRTTRAQMASLRSKWERVEVISAVPVLDSVLRKWEDEWTILDRNWAEQFLSASSEEIQGWTAEECSQWLQVAECPPPFIGAETRARLDLLRTAVYGRLEEIPVEAALAAYNRLTDKQKRQFLAIILSESHQLRA